MNEPSSEPKFRGTSIDWTVRAVIALAFLFFGSQKLSDAPGSQMSDFFGQIGAGQWLRYFTGALEVLGAALTLYPRTVSAGLVVLGCVVLCATGIEAAVLRDPVAALVPFAILCDLAAFWLHRRER
jgi:uncharacterized membrane protein YphA (DoxX/SURF4 family)